MFDKVDACGAQSDITAVFFGHESFMLQDFRPHVSGCAAIELCAADLKNFTGTYLR